MKKINIEFIFPLLALVLAITALSSQVFNAPPVGKLVDPFIGAVQNENDAQLNASMVIDGNAGLAEPVNIYFDERQVPHIYANNAEDMYFAQGYVVASYRLWQMDFLTYVSAGRLSEIFPEGYLDYDRKQRRMGILAAAKASLALIERDAETITALNAYTKGVNAYISQLGYKNMPLEYKLLNYQPEPWTNLKTVLIMKHMANMLSGYEEDYINSNMMLALGEEKYNKLFPGFDSHIAPIVNDATTAANPYLAYLKKPAYLDFSFLSSGSLVSKSEYNPTIGSNSWVVSGKKTKSGYPILASDPHLNLTLPAIWMEMQLSMPGSNVYGVSIPGTPAVIIGFNENIAWGITNGVDDVKDWYKLKLTDDYKQYELDGKWIRLDYSIEQIKRKGKSDFNDTIYRSVQGPIVCDKSFPAAQPELMNHALRWELHNASNEFLAFIKLNRAKNYADYKDAIKHYASPIQNFTFASKENDIAVNHQGRMPVKWQGQGKFILDGTTSAHLYNKYIPADSLPQLLNPDCNYVVSANQLPTGIGYAYYYNGYYKETRANRIGQILKNENAFDIQKMEAMQLDNVNVFAAEALQMLTHAIDHNKLSANEKAALQNISQWNGEYDAGSHHAKLFELWWNGIKELTWDELKTFSFGKKLPADYVLLDLISTEPGNEYFDKQGTSAKENANDIVTEAFQASFKNYDAGKRWSDFNKVHVMHMTNIPLFSRTNLASSGSPDAINAMATTVGPSWRMIVELGEKPKAYGIYVGGQSGNIGSTAYDDFVNDWNKGKYYQLHFYATALEAKQHSKNNWTLK